ncbi:MAG TPA: hypothetical protein VG693_05320 [Actinomycetes bacterium]|nr:hypothetical protein [Actinomycetes bacterium]
MGAHELVEAGRQHVATGRIREAMACFKRAADDPERGAEALSLLAAAYLLPGSLAPELALAHAHRAASHPAAGGEHLARCAAVALTAGDPSLAEELAGRAGGAGGGEALAIRATALLRLGDLARVRALLAGLERASGPAVFWRRLVVEASAAGRMDVALAVRRAMRRGGLPAPALPDVVVRTAAAPLFFACLAAATVLSVAVPEPLAELLALAFLVLGLGMAVLARRG